MSACKGVREVFAVVLTVCCSEDRAAEREREREVKRKCRTEQGKRRGEGTTRQTERVKRERETGDKLKQTNTTKKEMQEC